MPDGLYIARDNDRNNSPGEINAAVFPAGHPVLPILMLQIFAVIPVTKCLIKHRGDYSPLSDMTADSTRKTEAPCMNSFPDRSTVAPN